MKIKCTKIKYDEENGLAYPRKATIEIDDSYGSLLYKDALNDGEDDTELREAIEEKLEANAGGASVLSFEYIVWPN